MEGVKVAVVGGGFSGAMVAVNLARSGRARVVLIEKGERFARGVAYGSKCERHLLNVPAGMMSAFPDEPTHFLDWLRGRDPSAEPCQFVPRMVYGEYLEGLLADAVNGGRVELVRDEVVDLRCEGGASTLTLAGGQAMTADRVVLALGNPPPSTPAGVAPCEGLRGYVANPWKPDALDGLAEDDAIALIGTGLTAVDVAVEAIARGHRGAIVAISRHGLLPQTHRPASGPPSPHFLAKTGPATARSLLRTVRAETDRQLAEGGDWRPVVDGIRPVAQDLWRSLGQDERRRFLRHLASRWDAHRHRVAPEVADEILGAMQRGRLEVVAGRIVEMSESEGSIVLRLCRRGRAEVEARTFRRVINCTGPSRNVREDAPALVRALIDRGLARPGPLALGLDVAASGSLIDINGDESDRIFAIGPMRKEGLWETTAVRELRVQARDLTGHLVVPALY